MIAVIDLSEAFIPEKILHRKIITPFYNISLKTKTTMNFEYGRDYFDFPEGVLFGIAPDQIIEVDETGKKGDMGDLVFVHSP